MRQRRQTTDRASARPRAAMTAVACAAVLSLLLATPAAAGRDNGRSKHSRETGTTVTEPAPTISAEPVSTTTEPVTTTTEPLTTSTEPVTTSSEPVTTSPVASSSMDQQAAGTAQLWSTTNDGALRMALVGTAEANPAGAAPAGERLTVDTTVTGQSIVGFGAALTHSSAALLAALPAQQRRAVLTDLFDPDGAVRLSVLRVPLGGSDFVPSTPYTYADTPDGAPDWDLSGFTTSRDEDTLRPVLREIHAINPDVVVVASPWSAPAWMKTSGHLNAGALSSTDPRAIPAYAEYLVRAVVEHRDAGVPVDVLTVQNEPQTRGWGDYPRMEMPAAQQAELIEVLGPRLQEASPGTQILAFDHNWAQHPADVAAVPAGADPEHDYPARVLSSAAGRWVSGTAFHCYHGDASAQEPLHEQFPTKDIWVTECSGSRAEGDSPDKAFGDTLYWQTQHLMVASLRHWATSVMTWNLALDAGGGPHVGGCGTCTAVVTVQDGDVTANAEYYVLSHAARFVPRGAVRVATAVGADSLDPVAFRAPDGTVSVLIHHRGWQDQPVTVEVDGRGYELTVPPWSTSTVRVAPLG